MLNTRVWDPRYWRRHGLTLENALRVAVAVPGMVSDPCAAAFDDVDDGLDRLVVKPRVLAQILITVPT